MEFTDDHLENIVIFTVVRAEVRVLVFLMY